MTTALRCAVHGFGLSRVCDLLGSWDGDRVSDGGILIGAGGWHGCLAYIFEGMVALHGWD